VDGGEGTGLVRVRALDGMRGVAALTVFVYHLEHVLPIPGDQVVVGGFLGVDLFFVLSGFLITSQLLAHQTRSGHLGIAAYGAKRATRLLPLLAVYLAVAALYELAIGRAASDVGWSSLTNGLFLPGSVTGPIDYVPTLSTGHLWSLAVEVHFYLLMPLLVATFLHRRSPDWVAATALVVLLLATAVARRRLLDGGAAPLEVYPRSTARLDALFLGAAAAVLHRRRVLDPRMWNSAGWIGLGVLGIWAVTLQPYTPWLPQGGFTMIAFPAACLVLATALGAGPARVFERGPLPAIGRMSYGLYLWHLLVLLAVRQWLHAAPWPVQVAVAAGLTAALTLLSWHHIEAPLLRRLRTRLDGPGLLGRSEHPTLAAQPT
jgi:peptidoglycan/LPS O-acetylase OafA/YrhL